MAGKKKATKKAERVVSSEEQMLLDAGYEQVTGGAGEPWHEGQTLEGVFAGVFDSQFQQDDGEFAKLVNVETGNGVRTMRCPAILAKRMETLNDGDKVFILCRGKVKTGSGRQAWDFSVLVKRNAPARKGTPVKATKKKAGGRG